MISLILMSIAGMCKAVMDLSADMKPFRWGGEQSYWYKSASWVRKYKNNDPKQGPKFFGSTTIFVNFTDAWHLFQSINYFLIVAAIVLYSPITPIKIKALSILVDFLIIKIAHQSVFHVLFTWVLARKK